MKNDALKPLLFSLLALLLWNCKADKKNFDRVVYRYSDSSVDPQFYRSYTIVWQAQGKGSVSVDVYGDTIAKQDFEVKAANFTQLQALSQWIQSGGRRTSDASGTSHQLIELWQQGKSVYERYWDNLNKEEVATKAFIDFIKNNTPNLEKLLATPYNVKTTSRQNVFAKAEYDQLMASKKSLMGAKTSKAEAKILKNIWQLTRKHLEIEGGKKPAYILHLQIAQKKPEADSIRFQVYAEHTSFPQGTPWKERVVWQVDFSHRLLNNDNYQILLME